MKNKLGIIAISTIAMLGLVGNVCSCGKNNGVSDNTSTTTSDDQPLPDFDFDHWTDEQKALMLKWCGSVLPYSEDMFHGDIKFQEVYDSDNDLSYLEITDESTEFSLETYYEDLDCIGWNVIKTYNGKILQKDSSGTDFVELTYASADKTVGYDMMYFFTENNYTDDGKTYSCNVIRCYADLCSTRTTDTAWNAKELKTIKDVANMELPFINLGSTNSVSKVNYNVMQIIDTYVGDLSSEYASLLQKNGFTIDTELSTQYDSYVLSKTLEDGSLIQIQMYYYAGNGIYVYYTPNMKSYDSWPTDVIAEIKAKSGVEIPEFKIKEGGSYSYFKKNNTYYILSYDLLDQEDFNYDTYVYSDLRNSGLNWNETVSIMAYNFTEEDENEDGDIIDKLVGFQIAVEVTTPTSTFTKEWPSSAINDTVTKLLGVDNVTIPELVSSMIPASGKDIKYAVNGEDVYNEYFEYYYDDIKTNFEIYDYYGITEDSTDDEIKALAAKLAKEHEGIDVSIFDINELAFKGYCDILEKACWYEYTPITGDKAYEDPTGQIAIVLDTESEDEGKTLISIMPGSGVAHTPELYFEESDVIVAIGESKELNVISKMLPYAVSYSSSDTTGKITVDANGNVTVADDTDDGTTATITATLKDKDGKTYTATCTITAKKIIKYTENSAIQSVDTLIKDKGYTTTTKYIKDGELDFPRVTVNFGSMSIADVEKLVTENFVPEGFELPEGSEWTNCSIYVDDVEYEGVMLDYRIDNEACTLTLSFYIYTVNGNTMMFAEAI